MTKVVLFIFLTILIVSDTAEAQAKINLKFDASTLIVPVSNRQTFFRWGGAELEFEYEFKKDKLFGIISGLAGGVRKEKERWHLEGTYIFLRSYKSFLDYDGWEINFSSAFLYGYPGILFNQTWQDLANDGGAIGYVSVFPVKKIELPHNGGVKKMGMAYPVVSLSVRKDIFWHLHVEPTLDLRFIKLGLVESTFNKSSYQEKRFVSPSVGLRFGAKF